MYTICVKKSGPFSGLRLQNLNQILTMAVYGSHILKDVYLMDSSFETRKSILSLFNVF